MAVEHLHMVKRTVYIAEHVECEFRDVVTDNPPREKLCKCGKWIPYVEQTAISQEYKK
jgi:hypothetical protein